MNRSKRSKDTFSFERRISAVLAVSEYEPTLANFDLLAQRLSVLVGKHPVWTANYLHSLWKGYFKPSRKMVRAMERFEATLDDMPQFIVSAERIEVLAPEGRIPNGSYIMEAAKPCPNCGIMFVPNVPWRSKCPNCSPPK